MITAGSFGHAGFLCAGLTLVPTTRDLTQAAPISQANHSCELKFFLDFGRLLC